VKFSLLYEPWCSRRQPRPRDAFREALAHAQVADAVGFRVLWSLERALLEPRPGVDAPETWLAAVAQHTGRIRLGVGLRLLEPGGSHPVRVAEATAVLDVMSEGRAEVAIGAETQPQGAALAEWRAALPAIPAMWGAQPHAGAAPGPPYPDVHPRPVQRPHPPLWLAGTDPGAPALAGALGLGWLHLPATRPEGLEDAVRAYREALDRAQPVGAAVNACFAACVAATDTDTPAPSAAAIRAYATCGVDELVFRVPADAPARPGAREALRRFGAEVAPDLAVA